MGELLAAGVAAVRFDLTWGTLEYHLQSLATLQASAKQCGALVAMCLDLQGRTTTVVQPYVLQPDGFPLYDRHIVIADGQTVILTAAPDAVMSVPEVRRGRP